MAWLLGRPAVTSVIIGVKTKDQLSSNLGALEIVLSKEDLQELDKVSHRPAAYPGWTQSYNAKARVSAEHPFDGPSWSLGDRPL
ncbi:aldo/keto reductase [Thalassospira sp.]|uniref:aldo/keto reductase n=1 Tax=Thalassospira sp. TaxID=1912094 RepID=UPI003AA83FF4